MCILYKSHLGPRHVDKLEDYSIDHYAIRATARHSLAIIRSIVMEKSTIHLGTGFRRRRASVEETASPIQLKETHQLEQNFYRA